MDWRKYHETNGWQLWHRRLMHCPDQNIRDTILFVKGLEKLKDCQLDTHEKCPSCVIGRSTKKDNPWPGAITQASMPLGKGYFGVFVSSITSIEGYNYGRYGDEGSNRILCAFYYLIESPV